ncbi:MAG: uracil-DNA glycosylase [Candidatus Krumholzibacteriota bacterium]|nr:uracil-DNA glycosylase [Candidatus Krumholzibacteriota bacterium]
MNGIDRVTETAAGSLFPSSGAVPGAGGGSIDLDSLEKTVSRCTRCDLHKTRTKTVFGAGNNSSAIVFVGEAPGRDEDLSGIPFIGRAGKLLDKIIESIGLSRDDVYIANILKCRPPSNRDPNEDEVAACEGYLAEQLKIIDPVLICALGRVAAQNLLKTKDTLKRLRESTHRYNGIKVVVTYHPAALLRNPNFKRPTWEDMKLLRRLYDESVAGRRP